MRAEIKKWFDQADYDFETAKDNFKIKRYSIVVYLCQQSVEKALKALIVKREKEPEFFIKSHSLIFLGKKIKIPENFHSFLRDLTPHYTLARYPGVTEEAPYELYDENIAGEILKKTEELLKWIKQHS